MSAITDMAATDVGYGPNFDAMQGCGMIEQARRPMDQFADRPKQAFRTATGVGRY